MFNPTASKFTLPQNHNVVCVCYDADASAASHVYVKDATYLVFEVPNLCTTRPSRARLDGPARGVSSTQGGRMHGAIR